MSLEVINRMQGSKLSRLSKASRMPKAATKFSVENFNQKLEFYEDHHRSRESLKEKGIYDASKFNVGATMDSNEFVRQSIWLSTNKSLSTWPWPVTGMLLYREHRLARLRRSHRLSTILIRHVN